MHVHIALYAWKQGVTSEQISENLAIIESLAEKINGIVEISTNKNTSKYSEGFTHVILVRAENQAALDAYRNHPDHAKAAAALDQMEAHGIGVDFVTKR